MPTKNLFKVGERYKTNCSEIVTCLSFSELDNAEKYKEVYIFEYEDTRFLIITDVKGIDLAGKFGLKVIPHAWDL